jgi:putative nucleotidyltransferase with HDIG domain
LGALSQALDLVEGQPEGHALRTAEIGVRIARSIGLPDEDLADLYFASVLKDSGCSNNSVRIHQIFGGDDFLSKREVKFLDWTSNISSLMFAMRHTEVGGSLGEKLRRMASNLGPPKKVMNAVTEARCTRGAEISRMLNLRENVPFAILYLDEHWDGHGAPYGLKGAEIPLMARILCLAQTFDVFRMAYGSECAFEVIRARSGRWFDPDLVDTCISLKPEMQLAVVGPSQSKVFRGIPEIHAAAIDADVDRICGAFAMIIDAKSAFTAEHSSRVTEYCVELAHWFGYTPQNLTTLRRAALLHDLGKLAISSAILEKPSPLSDEEFDKVKQHPKLSDKILRQIPTFQTIAEIASSHHERLDGWGYWRGLEGQQLNLDARILTACDVFDALTARRPYRDALPVEKALSIMHEDEGTAFDSECLLVLNECFSDSLQIAA